MKKYALQHCLNVMRGEVLNMNNKNNIKLLKISLWIGAVTDALAAVIMIFPELRIHIFGAENFVISPAYRYALGLGASLMVGWTILLIWASIKPVERRGIYLITVFPVITGIITAQIFAVKSGYLLLNKVIPLWIHLTVVSALFIYSYFKSKSLAGKN